MIISADKCNDFLNTIYQMSNGNPFACRIISMYNSYNPSLVFVDYWMIIDDESKACCGAIARNGTAFVLYMTENADIDEVSSFMRVAGASSILCEGSYELDVYSSKSVKGSVLKRCELFEDIDESLNFVVPDIKKAYELILKCADENFNPPAFEDFYVDINHKLRHNTMRIYGVEEKGELVSVAMTVAESSTAGILGAVACNPDYRKQGFGSAIVKYLSDILLEENKTVYLYRAENANISFYNNLGFVEMGLWREYYL